MAFQLINLFCRLAGNLAPEREAFYQAVAECNEEAGIPRGVLLIPLSTGTYGPERKDAVDQNIEASRYFLLIVEDVWEVSAPSFLHDYKVAMKCLANDNLPMQEIVVAVKKTPEDDEPGDLAQFRAKLTAEGGPRHFEFVSVEDFREKLDGLLAAWMTRAAPIRSAQA